MGLELAPGRVFAGYRIDRVAGRGGMGVVYQATQLTLDRRVALKVVAPDFADDAAFRDRFQRESRLLAALDHPNVITIHEAGEAEGHLFIVMRYVEGTDLRSLLARDGSLELRRAAALVRQVGSALDAAHTRGLVHRDVKPANVLIEPRDGTEHAWLSDFGLTKKASGTTDGITATGQWVGTLDYVAPEQIEGEQVDARADVYSLGCVLFEALTGRVPFERDTDVAKMWAHIHEQPPVVSEVSADAPPAVDHVIRRALAKRPEDRYGSAGDLARATLAAARDHAATEPERTLVARHTAPSAGDPTVAIPATGVLRRRPARTALITAGAAAVAIAVLLLVLVAPRKEQTALEADALELSFVSLSSAPANLAAGEGAVWLAASDDATLTPIDSASGDAGEPIPLGEEPAEIATGEGGVWLSLSDTPARIVRVDPVDRQVEGAPVELEPRSTDDELTVGDGTLFAVSSVGGILERADTESGEPAGDPIELPAGSDGELASGAGAVWTATSEPFDATATVVRVDMDSGDVREIELPGTVGDLAFGDGKLFVEGESVDEAGRRVRSVRRIDPASNEPDGELRLDDRGDGVLALAAARSGSSTATVFSASIPRASSASVSQRPSTAALRDGSRSRGDPPGSPVPTPAGLRGCASPTDRREAARTPRPRSSFATAGLLSPSARSPWRCRAGACAGRPDRRSCPRSSAPGRRAAPTRRCRCGGRPRR